MNEIVSKIFFVFSLFEFNFQKSFIKKRVIFVEFFILLKEIQVKLFSRKFILFSQLSGTFCFKRLNKVSFKKLQI